MIKSITMNRTQIVKPTFALKHQDKATPSLFLLNAFIPSTLHIERPVERKQQRVYHRTFDEENNNAG